MKTKKKIIFFQRWPEKNSAFHRYILCYAKSLSLLRLFATPMNCSPPSSSVCGGYPGKNTGLGCHAFLQGIFPNQGSNPDLPRYEQILYRPHHQRSPFVYGLDCGDSFTSVYLHTNSSCIYFKSIAFCMSIIPQQSIELRFEKIIVFQNSVEWMIHNKYLMKQFNYPKIVLVF